MAKNEEYITYTIPNNFIDESRIVKGMFKTRNFIEGIVLALIVAGLALMIPITTITTRISVVVGLAGPFFFAGLAGYNGDPLSTAAKNAKNWRKQRATMLYNSNTTPLSESPLDTMMSQKLPKDKIFEFVESRRLARQAKHKQEALVEGVDFVFAEESDPNINYKKTEPDQKKEEHKSSQEGSDSPFETLEWLSIENPELPEIKVDNTSMDVDMEDLF